jgi:threonine aldolase
MDFASDNWAGVSGPILAAIAKANSGIAPAYGADEWTEEATKAFSQVFGQKLFMSAVPTGTAANSLAIELGCGRDGVLVCHEEAHCIGAEAASRALLNPGITIRGLKGFGGRIDPEVLEKALAKIRLGAKRGMVSLTNVTEAGMVYRPKEIAALAAIAKKAGYAVHIDGARFANAVAATGASPADLSWKSGVDLVSFGATKGGALAAEAVLAFDKTFGEAMSEQRKALGYTVSKGRFIACQLGAFLADGHWLDLARKANAMAKRLAVGMTDRQVRLAWPCEANEVMAIIRKSVVKKLRMKGVRCHDWPLLGNLAPGHSPSAGEIIVRFVASFATTERDVDAVLAAFG